MESFSRKQLWIATCLYLGFILYGFSGGCTASVITILRNPDLTPLPEVISEEQASWVGSVLYIGLITGPYITGYLSNIIGRKPCLLAGFAILGLSSALMVAAASLSMVFVGRIALGVGSGVIYVINLVYIAEIASTSIRGLLLTLCAVSTSAGTFMAYSIAPYISYRATMYITLGMSVIYFVAILLFVPETPIFYILKGDEKKAISILISLGRSYDIDELLCPKIETTREWMQIFTMKSNRKALIITLTLVILSYASGLPSLLLFATTVFDLVQMSVDSNVASILIGAVLLFSSSISSLIVDRYGRKKLLLFSTAVCCLCFMLLGTYIFLDKVQHSIVANLQLLPIILFGIFILSFNIGFGVIPGTFIGEMFQSNVRSLGSTITLTVGWFSGLIITTSFGYMTKHFGSHVPFWSYSTACLLAFVFTALFVPETKGKTFAEIQCLLNK